MIPPAEPDGQRERANIRRAMQQIRGSISAAQRQRFSEDIARHIGAARLLRPHARIALFASLRDEPDTAPLLRLAAAHGSDVFLPRIDSIRKSRMSFAPINGQWRVNRYGIVEPAGTSRAPARFMNVIFMPLLAFDARGTRLGMGGGYYDRALAFRRQRLHWAGPALIGIAYDAQQQPRLPAQLHDVRLDGIVTPRGIRWF
jgi:5-formyltetrahydrofolate cyclo-ligase